MSLALVHAVAVFGWVWWEAEMPLTDAMRDEYRRNFDLCVVNAAHKDRVEREITRMLKARPRYEVVSAKTGVPWYVIALIHTMECDGNFDCHLHNGDPLRERTVNEPKGRPATGQPPFGWERSAVDALQYDGFDVWRDWTLTGTLYKFETFNGLGYRREGVPTPYLWGSSNIYKGGKFVRDHQFDPRAVSDQVGAAVLLKRMAEQHLVEVPGYTPPVAVNCEEAK